MIMSLVERWLRGIGLDYAVPSFIEFGIVSPVALVQLDISDYDVLNITDQTDR